MGGLVVLDKYGDGGWSWFTAPDGQGNVAGLVSFSDGTTDGQMEYSPFGELLRASGRAADAGPLRWSTKYEDAETGLLYYGGRYYDPVMGRWLSRDPIGEAGGLNLYAFVGNDPVNEIDPLGEAGRGARPAVLIYRNDPNTVSGDLSVFNFNPPPDPAAVLTWPSVPSNEQSPILDNRPPARLNDLFLNTPQPNVNDVSVSALDPNKTYFIFVPRRTSQGTRDLCRAFSVSHFEDTEFGEQLMHQNSSMILAAPGAEILTARALAAIRVIRCAPKTEPVPLPGQRINLEPTPSLKPGDVLPELEAAETTAKLEEGSFSIINWSGYPENLPRPAGPFRLLEGAEYDAARAAANQANRAIHQADPSLKGLQIHEIQPVKFNGSPADPLNKIPLKPGEHSPATTWWNKFQRDLEAK